MSRTYRHRKISVPEWNMTDLIRESQMVNRDLSDFDNVRLSGYRYQREYDFDEHGELRFVRWVECEPLYDVRYSRNSKEGKRRIAKWHSDRGVTSYKEPGPSWFKNMTVNRPNRRFYEREIQKWFDDPDYEVQTYKRLYKYADYWT